MSPRVKRIRRKRVRSTSPFHFIFPSHRISAVVIFAAIAFGVLLIVYAPRAYRGWNEGRLLKRAATLLREQKFQEADRVAHEVLDLKPDSLPAFYILAEASEKENQVETVAWRAQIARLLPNDLASQLNLASAALRFGQLDVARKALEQIPPANRNKAPYHVVAGWLARAEGNEAEVEKQFAAAVAQEPANDLYQFNLAVIQIHSKDPARAAAAKRTLERLSDQTDFRAGSLRALLTDAVQRNDLHAADGLAQQLQMSSQVTFADYLLALDFYKKLDAKKFASLLEKVKPFAARTPSDLASLMNWMIEHGLAGEVVRWMEKLKPAQTSRPPPAVAVAEAFAAGKNWSRLKRWTHGGDWGDAEYLRLAYQAYAAREAHANAADAEFDSLWSSARSAAGDSAQRQLDLARLAMKWNLKIEAEELWLPLAKEPPTRREALDALAKIYRSRNDLPNLLQTLERVHDSSPDEADAAANYARLSLLLDHNTAAASELAKEAYDKAPDDLDTAVTRAFSLYGLGRTADGVTILQKFSPEQLRDPHIAVFAAVLLLDENQPDAAKEFIEAAQRGPIFPEEKRLLEDARARSSASPTPSPTRAPAATPP